MKDFDFDKHFETMNKVQRIAVFVIIGGWVLGLSTLGFAVWVIIKVMAHYGIL